MERIIMVEDLKLIIEELQDFDCNRPINLLFLFSIVEEAEIPDDFIKECKKEIEKYDCFKKTSMIEYLSGFKMTRLLGIEK